MYAPSWKAQVFKGQKKGCPPCRHEVRSSDHKRRQGVFVYVWHNHFTKVHVEIFLKNDEDTSNDKDSCTN
eukprot:8208609-Karenia_brevis.AAC.1